MESGRIVGVGKQNMMSRRLGEAAKALGGAGRILPQNEGDLCDVHHVQTPEAVADEAYAKKHGLTMKQRNERKQQELDREAAERARMWKTEWEQKDFERASGTAKRIRVG